jgi:TPR repeat protein
LAPSETQFASLKKPSLIAKSLKREALDRLENGAKLGISCAQFKLAECYRSGFGVEKDISVAMDHLAKASANGYPGAKEGLVETISGSTNLPRSIS